MRGAERGIATRSAPRRSRSPLPMRTFVHYIPIVTTVIAALFAMLSGLLSLLWFNRIL